MIRSSNTCNPNQVSFTNGEHSGVADVPKAKNGNGQGFGPHELLEAALATCMTITAAKYAAKQEIPIEGVSTEVRLVRKGESEVTLEYRLVLSGAISEAQRQHLETAVSQCPVAKTLSGLIACTPILA